MMKNMGSNVSSMYLMRAGNIYRITFFWQNLERVKIMWTQLGYRILNYGE